MAGATDLTKPRVRAGDSAQFTVMLAVWLWDSAPLVAVTVNVRVPRGVREVLMVSVDVPPDDPLTVEHRSAPSLGPAWMGTRAG